MKAFRWTYVFVIAVGALLAFTIYDNQRLAEKKEIAEQEQAVMKTSIDSVSKFEIINRLSTLALEKGTDGKWNLTSPIHDLADTQAVDSFLAGVQGEKTIRTVVSGDEYKAETFGLDKPTVRLRIHSAGKTHELKIGAVKAYDSNLYAQLDDEKKAILVSSAWDALLAKLPKDFRDKHLLRSSLKSGDIKKIIIKNRQMPAPLELVKEGETWKAAGGAEAFPLSMDLVSKFVDQIKGVRAVEPIEGPRAEKAASSLLKPDFELALFGERKDPLFAARFKEEPEAKDRAKTSDHGGHQHDKGGVNLIASSSDLKAPVVVAKGAADTVRKTAHDFYDRKSPFSFKPAEVARIEIEAKVVRGRFEKKKGDWINGDPGLQKEDDNAKLSQLVEKLSQLEAVRVFGPSKSDAKRQAAMKNPARVILKKEDGGVVFEFAWGDAATDTISGVEARYLIARTSLSDHFLGIREGDVNGLALSSLYKEKTPPPPAASPPPK